jgi:hypothetical protein
VRSRCRKSSSAAAAASPTGGGRTGIPPFGSVRHFLLKMFDYLRRELPDTE